MCIGALFKIAKLWNQHRCQSTEEWIKERVAYIQNRILFSHKKKKIHSSQGNDITGDHHVKQNKPDPER